jgi:hypothetical protein
MSEPRPERDEYLLLSGAALAAMEQRMGLITKAKGGRPRAITGGTALRIAHPSGKD